MANTDLLTPFVKAILSGCRALKRKETRLCDRNRNIFTHNSYPCLCFHFIVNEISRNKTKNCPKRLTAVEQRALRKPVPRPLRSPVRGRERLGTKLPYPHERACLQGRRQFQKILPCSINRNKYYFKLFLAWFYGKLNLISACFFL